MAVTSGVDPLTMGCTTIIMLAIGFWDVQWVRGRIGTQQGRLHRLCMENSLMKII